MNEDLENLTFKIYNDFNCNIICDKDHTNICECKGKTIKDKKIITKNDLIENWDINDENKKRLIRLLKKCFEIKHKKTKSIFCDFRNNNIFDKENIDVNCTENIVKDDEQPIYRLHYSKNILKENFFKDSNNKIFCESFDVFRQPIFTKNSTLPTNKFNLTNIPYINTFSESEDFEKIDKKDNLLLLNHTLLIVILSIIVFLFLIFGVFIRYRFNTKKKLKQKNQKLDLFYARLKKRKLRKGQDKIQTNKTKVTYAEINLSLKKKNENLNDEIIFQNTYENTNSLNYNFSQCSDSIDILDPIYANVHYFKDKKSKSKKKDNSFDFSNNTKNNITSEEGELSLKDFSNPIYQNI